ncbi:MAG: N-acetylneuraminate synthase [Lentisphaerae bacterium GWF2_45_14]|nr:MAG: N-acetylneuraminate synthase [Lentisphaerae bacterium GWF2_45_14]
MTRTIIIAEGGVNHNGSVEVARKLCDAALKAGADVIKFQTFRTECNVLKDCDWVDYQKKNAPDFESHFQMLKSLELTDDEFITVKDHCDKIGIQFLSTPSDLPSLELLVKMGLETMKISSSDVTNIPLLRKIGRLNKEVILSTGMSSLKEVQMAVDELVKSGTPKDNITLLHCHSDYPTKFEDANLRVMLTLKETFGTRVGLSDHSEGIELAIAAAALGATVIEKHFTLDRRMEGPDQKMSTEPKEFAKLVSAVRNLNMAMGDGIKRISPSEEEIRRIYGKGIVSLVPIAKNEIFTDKNITVKRPCKGLSVLNWDKVVGKKAKKDFAKDEPIV